MWSYVDMLKLRKCSRASLPRSSMVRVDVPRRPGDCVHVELTKAHKARRRNRQLRQTRISYQTLARGSGAYYERKRPLARPYKAPHGSPRPRGAPRAPRKQSEHSESLAVTREPPRRSRRNFSPLSAVSKETVGGVPVLGEDNVGNPTHDGKCVRAMHHARRSDGPHLQGVVSCRIGPWALLPRRRQHVRSGEGARQSGSPEFVHLLSPRFMSSGSGTFLRVIDRPVAGAHAQSGRR